MNILPKKRWHVRTKANIERVRRDEAEALAREQQQERRAQIAKQEARIELLRNKSSSKVTTEEDPSAVLGNLQSSDATNKEHEEEKKNERENFEKKIGLLNCLGQSVDKEPWYLKSREKPSSKNFKEKHSHLDPLYKMEKYVSAKKRSSGHTEKGSQPKTSKSKDVTIIQQSQVRSYKQLREMREQREKKERERTRQLLEKRTSACKH